MQEKRFDWIDIAKGIGIILVAFAHIKYSALSTYIYWFHMPMFFMISGLLYKGVNDAKGLRTSMIKKSYSMMIPYAAFGIVILLMLITLFQIPFSWVYITNFIKGGQALDGIFGPFWFIPVMYFTQILFLLLDYFMDKRMVFAMIVIFYICSHMFLKDIVCWWNADVTLYAVALYYIGVLFQKRKAVMFSTKAGVLTAVFSVVFILLQATHMMDYTLDMKHKAYTHPVLDLIIPVSLSLLVFFVAGYLERLRFGAVFKLIGRYTLPIMYLHVPIAYFCMQYFQWMNIYVVIILSIALPVLAAKCIFERFPVTKGLFLGKSSQS